MSLLHLPEDLLPPCTQGDESESCGTITTFVTAKDVILKILQILTTKGNVGFIVEYGGRVLRS